MGATPIQRNNDSSVGYPALSNPIADIVFDIRKALRAGAYRSALALALTLPDICQKAEEIKGDSGYNSYARWFDDNVAPFYECEWEGRKQAKPVGGDYKYPVFDGMACYRLRCSLLHSGDIVPSGSPIDEFELTVIPGLEGRYGSSMGLWVNPGSTEGDRAIRRCTIDLAGLCDAISKCALECYEKSDKKDAYQKHSWRISTVHIPSELFSPVCRTNEPICSDELPVDGHDG